MKRFLIVLTLVLGSAAMSMAQKFCIVDTEYILAKIPQYKEAQAELDRLSVQWQKEIEAKYAEIDKLYKAYQAEQILLTEEMKKKRENEIIQREKEAKELQKQKFGVDGELFKKRQDLIKPIQDNIYNKIKEVADKKQYAVVFDKSSDLTILYASAKYDISDEVLEALGYNSTGK